MEDPSVILTMIWMRRHTLGLQDYVSLIPVAEQPSIFASKQRHIPVTLDELRVVIILSFI